MTKSLVSDFLKAVVSKKDVRDVIDRDLIYPLGINSHLFDEGTQYPTAFLMFDYPNTLYSKILDEFRSLFMPEQYDAKSYEIFMGLNDGKKKKEKYAKEDFLSFNRELYKSVDDKNDYSELYTKITGDVPKKSPVKLGEMIYTISQKIMSEDYDEIDNSRKIFAGIMTTALVAKCASLGSENLIKQANEIDKFLASALYATLPEETKKHSSEIFDEICELTRSALRKCGLPEENVKKYFSALNIYDQTHSSSTTPSEWNYSFTKNAANTFIAFNDNGRITNYFNDMRLIDMSIQEMLNNLKAHPSNDTYAYSLIQKIGASLTGKEYKPTQIRLEENQIKLEELNKVDAQTILLTTLNLLSTIEKGVDPSKKEDFDKLVATLVLPATELNASMTNQEKEAILEKMKQLCASDPEISAIAGISDIFSAESDELKIKRLTVEKTYYSTKKKSLEKENAEKDEKIKRLTAERNELSTKKDALEKENAKKDEEIKRLTAEKNKLAYDKDVIINEKRVLHRKNTEKDEEIERLTAENRISDAAVNAKPKLKKSPNPYTIALKWLKTEIKNMSIQETTQGNHDTAEKLNNLFTNLEFYKKDIKRNNLKESIKKTNIPNQLSVHIGMLYCSDVAARTININEDQENIITSLQTKIIPQMLSEYGQPLPDDGKSLE